MINKKMGYRRCERLRLHIIRMRSIMDDKKKNTDICYYYAAKGASRKMRQLLTTENVGHAILFAACHGKIKCIKECQKKFNNVDQGQAFIGAATRGYTTCLTALWGKTITTEIVDEAMLSAASNGYKETIHLLESYGGRLDYCCYYAAKQANHAATSKYIMGQLSTKNQYFILATATYEHNVIDATEACALLHNDIEFITYINLYVLIAIAEQCEELVTLFLNNGCSRRLTLKAAILYNYGDGVKQALKFPIRNINTLFVQVVKLNYTTAILHMLDHGINLKFINTALFISFKKNNLTVFRACIKHGATKVNKILLCAIETGEYAYIPYCLETISYKLTKPSIVYKEKTCVICYLNEPSLTIIPCGHKIYCIYCYKHISETITNSSFPLELKCSVCRCWIENVTPF